MGNVNMWSTYYNPMNEDGDGGEWEGEEQEKNKNNRLFIRRHVESVDTVALYERNNNL